MINFRRKLDFVYLPLPPRRHTPRTNFDEEAELLVAVVPFQVKADT